uniref:Uncharacterized protein n=1 Tax=Nelumbo nucifera TaxID=4432 RepID=A0A822ZZG3_NELNU|nr:TPA_asm: hypothetical protein HUJ06_018153 [Nelumbo nucifera]
MMFKLYSVILDASLSRHLLDDLAFHAFSWFVTLVKPRRKETNHATKTRFYDIIEGIT